MGCKNFFNFPRIHVQSAAYNYIRDAVCKVEIAFFVHLADVACMKPSAAKNFFEEFWTIVIPLHYRVTPDDYLAIGSRRQWVCVFIDDLHFYAPYRQAD